MRSSILPILKKKVIRRNLIRLNTQIFSTFLHMVQKRPKPFSHKIWSVKGGI